MATWISKVHLKNFKRFSDFEIGFKPEKNILIGDNEAGKTSVLDSIDLVLSGSESKVKAIGIDNLFNYAATRLFLALPVEKKNIAALPVLSVDVYLDGVVDTAKVNDLHGRFADGMKMQYGLRMLIKPNDELQHELKEYLAENTDVFPYDFYKVEFLTFGNVHYSSYKKFLRHLVIDNSSGRFEHATNGFIKDAYQLHVGEAKDRAKLESSYRTHKSVYEVGSLKLINELLEKAEGYTFGIKSGSKSNLETDLTILKDSISIESLGLGERVFIKTKFSLNNKKRKQDPDVVLIEEPENHLSYNKMHLLIDLIKKSKNAQVFISTHSNMISSRLDLRNCIFIRKDTEVPVSLKSLDSTTATFFEKAPTVSILDFVLAKKVTLVEGAAEYILLQKLFAQEYGINPEDADIQIVSIGGLSFKRYMEVAKIMKIKTAVIRDNDKDPQKNCIDNYAKHITEDIKVFFENDANMHTFEKCLYGSNEKLCEKVFENRKDALSYMLSSKADAAFELAEQKAKIIIPDYIKGAFEWIKD